MRPTLTAKMVRDWIRPSEANSWIATLLPMIVVLLLGVLLWWFMMKRMNSVMGDSGKQMNFGKAKVKQMADEKRKTTFADVAGAGRGEGGTARDCGVPQKSEEV